LSRENVNLQIYNIYSISFIILIRDLYSASLQYLRLRGGDGLSPCRCTVPLLDIDRHGPVKERGY
jgi:hypothetical protein